MPNHIATVTENDDLIIDGISINRNVFTEERCMYYAKSHDEHFDFLLDAAKCVSEEAQREMVKSDIKTLIQHQDDVVMLNIHDNHMIFKSTRPEAWDEACEEILECHHELNK